MAPVVDVGTFALGRIGVSGHPVAWVWRKASTPAVLDEHWAFYRAGDAAEGFLRPNAATIDLGYEVTFIPTSTDQPLDFANLAAYKTFVRNAAIGSGMDPTKLVHVRAESGAAAGAVAAFLGFGFQRVRHTDDPLAHVVAWAQRKTLQFTERWRTCDDAATGYQTPGTIHRTVELWFTGSGEVEPDEFDNIVQGEDVGHTSTLNTYAGISE